MPLVVLSTYLMPHANQEHLILVGCILVAIVLTAGVFFLWHKKTMNGSKKQIESLVQKIEKLEQQLSVLVGDKKELIRKLGDARAKADESELLKANFLANMSHEIRTPMNGIIGFVQLLNEEISQEKRRQFIDIIINSGYQLVNLFDNLVDISRLDSGLLTISKSDCNLNELLFDLYVQFNGQIFKESKRQLTLRFLNLADDEVNIINTDCARLKQVFSHLISNAIKFTEKGTVEFGFTNNGSHELLFFVRDSGIGIPTEKLDVIFERFQQIEQGATRRFGGTGLGLYISKGLIEALDGKIWVESEEQVGSTFYFTIPFEKVEIRQDVSVYYPYKKEYNWTSKTILLVDDTEVSYHFVADLLANTRATVVRARTRAEALSLCESLPAPDLVIVDTHLETIDGYGLTSEIRKTRSKAMLPIIAQTNYSKPDDELKFIEVGCNDTISKPINPELLFSKIARVISVD